MKQYRFGDIVLVEFPFSDGLKSKKRPALVLRQFEDNDVLLCRITSKINSSEFDVFLENWKVFGLLLESEIRVHKIATIESVLIAKTLGKIDQKIKDEIEEKFQLLIK